MPVTPSSSDIVEKPVYVNRIRYDHDIVDGMGHACVRRDKLQDIFLLTCNRAPAGV